MTQQQLATTGNHAAPAVHVPNAFEQYAAEANTRTIVGELLKFAKGEWTKGKNDTVVPLGTKFVADVRNVTVGWVRWDDKKPVEHIIGKIADFFKPSARNTLGYTDKTEWEFDKNGQAQDPWQLTSFLFLMDDHGEIYTYSPASHGGRNAIVDLCATYGKLMRQHPGKLPVVELGTDSYRHAQYGKLFNPVLKTVGWHDEADFDAAQEDEIQEAKAREEVAETATQQAPVQQQAPAPVQQAAPPPVAPIAPVVAPVAPLAAATDPQPAETAPAGDAGFGFKRSAKAARF